MLLRESTLRKIIKNIILESNRFINYEPVELTAKNMNINFNQQNNFINITDVDEMKEYLREIAGPDIFMSFVDDWENMGSSTPPLSINPTAQFHTPHGLYFFPLNKMNVESFIENGMPVFNSFYGSMSKYFHLVKIDLNHPNVFIFNQFGICNKKLNYRNCKIELNEITRIYYNFMNAENVWQKININNLESFQTEIIKAFENSRIFAMNKSNFGSNNYYLYLYSFIDWLTKKGLSDMWNYATTNMHNNSELSALLCSSIGMKCIIDKGSSTIAQATKTEPTQTVIINFGEDESYYHYIGTFKNILNDRFRKKIKKVRERTPYEIFHGIYPEDDETGEDADVNVPVKKVRERTPYEIFHGIYPEDE